MQRASADLASRRFKPAARLRRGGGGGGEGKGDVPQEELLSILAAIEEWMTSADTRTAA